MKVVVCLAMVTLLVGVTIVDVDGVCPVSARKADSPGNEKFSKNKNANKALIDRAFGRKQSGFAPRNQFSARQGSSGLGVSRSQFSKLKRQLKLRQGRTKRQAVFPDEKIGSCCRQINGYIVGVGNCILLFPSFIPSVRCPLNNCYEGYWWKNRDGLCRRRNRRRVWAIVLCFNPIHIRLLRVNAYCNCGCVTC